MEYKRVTLLCGHYGSGKTNVAVNMAQDLKNQFPDKKVAVADLDIVNPYFRSLDSKDDLMASGIRMICSEFANTNVDLPALPQEIYSIVDEKDQYVIVDVGGDERGALALGRIAPGILAENDFDMLLVVNRFRPLTPDAASVKEVMDEISAACGLPFTGIVNDSNLGADTDEDTVISSLDFGKDVSDLTGLPIVATCCEASLAEALKDKIPGLFPLHLQKRPVEW